MQDFETYAATVQSDCAIRVTLEILAKLLGLPEHARITAAFQDADDHVANSASLLIVGVGLRRPEGANVRYVPLSDIEKIDLSSCVVCGGGNERAENERRFICGHCLQNTTIRAATGGSAMNQDNQLVSGVTKGGIPLNGTGEITVSIPPEMANQVVAVTSTFLTVAAGASVMAFDIGGKWYVVAFTLLDASELAAEVEAEIKANREEEMQ